MSDLSAAFDKAVGEVEGEQSKDPAPSPVSDTAESKPATPEEKGTDPAPAKEGSEKLLADEDNWRRLKDPEERLRELDKAFTEKTQKLSAKEKELEPYRELIHAFQADQKGTIKAIASQLGLTVSEAKELQKELSSQPAGDSVSILREALGPELDFLADKLAPALEKIASAKADSAIAPIKSQQEKILEQQIVEHAEQTLKAFKSSHPDVDKYWGKMGELSKTIANNGMKNDEFLELLYTFASRGAVKAEATQQAVAKIKESAAKSESPNAGVPASQVDRTPPKLPGNLSSAFDKAAQDAKAGIVYT